MKRFLATAVGILLLVGTISFANFANAGAIDDAVRVQQIKNAAREYNLYVNIFLEDGTEVLLKFVTRIEASETLRELFREIRIRDSRINVYLTSDGPAARADIFGDIRVNYNYTDAEIIRALRDGACECAFD